MHDEVSLGWFRKNLPYQGEHNMSRMLNILFMSQLSLKPIWNEHLSVTMENRIMNQLFTGGGHNLEKTIFFMFTRIIRLKLKAIEMGIYFLMYFSKSSKVEKQVQWTQIKNLLLIVK